MIDNSFPLIIGDSITNGYVSSDGTGDLNASFDAYEQKVEKKIADYAKSAINAIKEKIE